MKSFLILVAIVASMSGCYYDKAGNLYPAADSCSINNVSFAATVQPIINQYCAISGCHDASSTNGYILTTYDLIKVQGNNGQLVGTISHKPNFSPMPQGLPSLSTCQINQIAAWVNAQCPNN